jgi:fatty acid desaturase
MIGLFWTDQARRLRAREPGLAPIWIRHMVGMSIIMVWVIAICGMPIWVYLLCFVYTGAGFTRLRSFAEHRHAFRPQERTAIVERGGLLGLLYLNNNLHALHHLRPTIAWYRLPAVYAAQRADLLRRNGGLVYDGYGDVVRRFLFSMHDQPRHPASSTTLVDARRLLRRT